MMPACGVQVGRPGQQDIRRLVMRRFAVLASVIAAMLLGLLALQAQPVTIAQEATPAAMGGHPLVGTWLLDTNTADPANGPEVTIFTADGAYISVDAEGFPNHGVWEATGERTAALTIVSPGMEEEGVFAGTFMVRASVEVDETGDSFTAQYTGEFVTPDGTETGEYGPGSASATRIAVEPMGTPAGPIEVLFQDEAAATPTS
jgi:hypothetical protein